jgi:hypothetical protein
LRPAFAFVAGDEIMARYSILLAAAAFVATSALGAAQDQAGARVVSVAHQLAVCSLRANPVAADAFVSHGTPAADSAGFGQLLDDRCLPRDGYPPLDPRLVRGALYEAMYDRDYASGGPIDFANAPAPTVPGDGVNPSLDAALLQFGACVVRAAPADARALLASQQGSSGEAASIAALNPHLSPCMVRGLTITFSAPMLRGVLAEAMYKLSRGAPAMAAR